METSFSEEKEVVFLGERSRFFHKGRWPLKRIQVFVFTEEKKGDILFMRKEQWKEDNFRSSFFFLCFSVALILSLATSLPDAGTSLHGTTTLLVATIFCRRRDFCKEGLAIERKDLGKKKRKSQKEGTEPSFSSLPLHLFPQYLPCRCTYYVHANNIIAACTVASFLSFCTWETSSTILAGTQAPSTPCPSMVQLTFKRGIDVFKEKRKVLAQREPPHFGSYSILRFCRIAMLLISIGTTCNSLSNDIKLAQNEVVLREFWSKPFWALLTIRFATWMDEIFLAKSDFSLV